MNASNDMQSLEGKTLRFHFSNGPMKGKAYDHIFHRGGTVEWGPEGGDKTRNENAAIAKVADGVFVGSYMSDKGYTLTTTFNVDTGKLVSFASDGKEWSRHDGKVEVVS
jgi:molybdenum cofactor biosynthesis protein MoaF